jgi:hypothetical protein
MFNPTEQLKCNYNQQALYNLLAPIPGHPGVTPCDRNIRQHILKIVGFDVEQYLGTAVEAVTIARLNPKQRVEIHTDSDYKGDPTKKAINLPVTDCRGVFMSWFVVRPGCAERIIVAAGGHKIRGLARQDAECVFTIECDRPLIVRPDTFHDIGNKSNQKHLIISIR